MYPCTVKMVDILKVPFSLGMRRLFYAVTPNETAVPTLEDVPPYIDHVSKTLIKKGKLMFSCKIKVLKGVIEICSHTDI